MWTTIQYIGTPVALIAFITAVVAWGYSMKLKAKSELLKVLPKNDRENYLEKELESYHIDKEQKNVTGKQKFELVQLVILQRAQRMKILAMLAIGLASILAITIIVTSILTHTGDVNMTVGNGVASHNIGDGPVVINNN